MLRHRPIRRRVITPAVQLVAPKPEVDVPEADSDGRKAIVNGEVEAADRVLREEPS